MAMDNGRYVLAKVNGSPALQWLSEPLPQPAPGEVRLKLLAAGVAFSDLMRLRGLYSGDPDLPFTPGWDCAGEIDAVGDGVTAWRKGQRVVALTSHGNFARYRTVAAAELVAIPDGVDPAEAVCLCLNYVTAHQLLHRMATAQAGEAVLVHGAAGGVGTALLQLGKIAGLKMYGVASTHRLASVEALGAVAIDRTAGDFGPRLKTLLGAGVDVVLDPIGGRTLAQSFRALGPGGRLVWYGMASILSLPRSLVPLALAWDMTRLFAWKLWPGGRRTRFYSIGAMRKQHAAWVREDLTLLLGWLRERRIVPVIAKRLPLRDAPQALELLAAGKAEGKLVLMCQE